MKLVHKKATYGLKKKNLTREGALQSRLKQQKVTDGPSSANVTSDPEEHSDPCREETGVRDNSGKPASTSSCQGRFLSARIFNHPWKRNFLALVLSERWARSHSQKPDGKCLLAVLVPHRELFSSPRAISHDEYVLRYLVGAIRVQRTVVPICSPLQVNGLASHVETRGLSVGAPHRVVWWKLSGITYHQAVPHCRNPQATGDPDHKQLILVASEPINLLQLTALCFSTNLYILFTSAGEPERSKCARKEVTCEQAKVSAPRMEVLSLQCTTAALGRNFTTLDAKHPSLYISWMIRLTVRNHETLLNSFI
jgi:hypothetical protein